MDNYTIIKAFGLETRTWTYREDHGYGCAECCWQDRCDEDCTAKYYRANCPHCKGKGWIKKEDIEPMTNNTQLPAEVLSIDVRQKIHEDAVNYHNSTVGLNNIVSYIAGATEYATKLHQAQQENAELKRWKMDTIETQLVPIGAYCHEYLEVGLDDNHSLLVIAELERLKQENKEWKEECERLAKVTEYWQQEYYKLNPPRQPLKIDNNPIG
jgi:hypothetical protein